MFRLTTLLRSLGPSGAVANVQSVLDDRERQDWVVEGLVRRIGTEPAPLVLPAEPARVA